MPATVFEELLERALEAGAEFQTWPGHFLFKHVETEILFSQVSIPSEARMLELGCGNGFQSLLLASRCRHLVATDLFAPNPHSHSVGLDKAARLFERCKANNITLLSCAAEAMPFADEQFDIVFSSSVMEHIGPRCEALREMCRVLKPGGRLIMAVPPHVASLCTFPHQWLYIAVRAAQVLGRKLFRWEQKSPEQVPSARKVQEQNSGRSLRQTWVSFWRNHPSFPWPEPHGTYASIFEELRAQVPSRWRSMVEVAGFKVDRSFALTLVPISLLEVFSPALMARVYDRTKEWNKRLADHPLAQSLTYIWAVSARKSHLPMMGASPVAVAEKVYA